MSDLPWGIIAGLGIVLGGTLWFIIYILMLDRLEKFKD